MREDFLSPNKEILYVEEIFFEDCGVLGGRSFASAGTEYQVLDGTSISYMLTNILFTELKKQQSGKTIYPFTRIAICGVYLNGRVFAARVDEKSLETDKYLFVDDLRKHSKAFGLSQIGECFSAWDAQLYAILQQIDDDTFRAIGYKTPPSKDKYGYAYDVFRCLDLRGICRAPVKESRLDFHNYGRYDIGEDFYIESIDNEVTSTREFWLCRDFEDRKYLVSAYDPDDLNYRGVFDSDGNLIIDADIAEKICALTDPHEFIFIDNEYKLSMRGLEMDGDDE